MGNELQTDKTSEQLFQEKMQERLRAAMGDLMPDEVLAGLVKRGVEEAFFKVRKVERQGTYGARQYDEHPPWLIEFLQKEVKERVAAEVREWLKANPKTLEEALDKALAGGIATAAVRAFNAMLEGPVERL